MMIAHRMIPLDACADAKGHLYLWVWVLGGVTRKGRELDPEPAAGMYPSRELALAAAKKLGPKVWPVAALHELRGKVKWSK